MKKFCKLFGLSLLLLGLTNTSAFSESLPCHVGFRDKETAEKALNKAKKDIHAEGYTFAITKFRFYEESGWYLQVHPDNPKIAAELEALSRNSGADIDCGAIPAEKPVIYLYPEQTQQVMVRLDYSGELGTTYPDYDERIHGWKVLAHPNGQLLNLEDNQEYSYLFWEGRSFPGSFDLSTGFIVPGNRTQEFLQAVLKKIGLTPREYNEFIVYWLPRMQDNPYNLIHFAGEEYTREAPLHISPEPDAMLRVFMVYKALSIPIQIPEQKIEPFVRKGFTVVEWGGTAIK